MKSLFSSFLSVLSLVLTFYLYGVAHQDSCPKTPSIWKVYVAHMAEDLAEPYYYATIYWNTISDWCQTSTMPTSNNYYEVYACNYTNCSVDNSESRNVSWTKPSKVYVSFPPTDTFMFVKIRAVNADGNQSDWSDTFEVDLRKPNPEPRLFMLTYVVADIKTPVFEGNPYGLFLQPDLWDYQYLPVRLATVPWPMYFDRECCDTDAIIPAAVEPEALNFELTEDILKYPENYELNLNYRLWFAFDWVSAHSYVAMKLDGQYYVVKVDDSAAGQSGKQKRVVVIQKSPTPVYQVLCNPLSSQLFWTQRNENDNSSYEIMAKLKDEAPVSLSESCLCMNHLNITSPAIEFDWRTFYREEIREAGLVFVANDSVWSAYSVFDNCTCNQLISNVANVSGGDEMVQIGIDYSYFYWLSGNGLLKAYKWKTSTVNTYWGGTSSKSIKNYGNITQFKVYAAEHRPFSPTQCFYPVFKNVTFKMTSKTEATLSLELDWDDSEPCQDITKPPLDYEVSYGLVTNESLELANASCDILECKHMKFTWSREFLKQIPLENLMFNKTYFIHSSVIPTDRFREPYEPYKRGKETHVQFVSSNYIPDVRRHVPLVAIIGSVTILVFVFVGLAILLIIYFRKFRPFRDIPKIWARQLESIGKISEGNFGEVWKEILRGKRTVAVKYLKENAGYYEERCFLQEMRIMWSAKSPYVVELLGICLTGRQFMVLEFIDGKTLCSHLRNLKIKKYADIVYNSILQRDDERDIMKVLIDVSKACVYLEEIGILHRDLAGRNIMVTYSSNTGRIDQTKLIDFGLAKEIDTASDRSYQVPSGVYRELPAALFSPEAFATWIFTPKTEIWAFGILLWETFSLGDTPYGGKGYEEIEEFLKRGSRLPRPHHCSDDRMYTLIESCWKLDPSDRPNFKMIQNDIEDISRRPFKPSALVHPQPANMGSVEQLNKKKSSWGKNQTSGSSTKSHPMAVPTQAYSQMKIIENPAFGQTGENIEMPNLSGTPLVVRTYETGEGKHVPKMTGAYVGLQVQKPVTPAADLQIQESATPAVDLQVQESLTPAVGLHVQESVTPVDSGHVGETVPESDIESIPDESSHILTSAYPDKLNV